MKVPSTHEDYDSCLNCKQKAPLHLNLFGEYFQSIRILFKHCGHNRKNTNKEDCRVKSESEQIEQDCRAESESGQNFGPLSTTPPSPRAPPAGLLPPLQLPGPGDCKAGYLLPVGLEVEAGATQLTLLPTSGTASSPLLLHPSRSFCS